MTRKLWVPIGLALVLLPLPFASAWFEADVSTEFSCDDCIVMVYDISNLKAQAATGSVLLPVGTHSFTLLVSPAPWGHATAGSMISATGSVVGSVDVHAQTFVGRVSGQPGSLVLLGLGDRGVDGFLHLADGTLIDLQPYWVTNPGAPVGQTLARAMWTTPPSSSGGADDQVTPDMRLWGDNDLVQAAGGSANAFTRMRNIFDRMNIHLNNDIGSFFDWAGSTVCTAESCDSSRGYNTDDSNLMLHDHAWASYNERSTRPYEHSYLFVRRNVDVSGAGSEPGRYALERLRDSGNQHSWSSNYEASLVMMHEVGHTINANHNDADQWFDYERTCSLIELGPICIIQGEEPTTQHDTIMCGSCKDEPPEYVWEPFFSDTNWDHANSCFEGTWTSGEYEPWTPEWMPREMDMGSSC